MSNAIIDRTATVGEGTKCGNYTVIEENVVIGRGCLIGHNVVIHAADEKGESTVQRSWKFYVIPLERASISQSSRLS